MNHKLMLLIEEKVKYLSFLSPELILSTRIEWKKTLNKKMRIL